MDKVSLNTDSHVLMGATSVSVLAQVLNPLLHAWTSPVLSPTAGRKREKYNTLFLTPKLAEFANDSNSTSSLSHCSNESILIAGNKNSDRCQALCIGSLYLLEQGPAAGGRRHLTESMCLIVTGARH